VFNAEICIEQKNQIIMSNRINIGKIEPAAYKAMMALEHYLDTTGRSPIQQ